MKNRPYRNSTQLSGCRQRGFTLLELMVTVTVLGVLLGLAVPSFTAAMRNNRIVSQNNEFIGALNYARSEAIRRSSTDASDKPTCRIRWLSPLPTRIRS